jgi:hypothetical protein
MGLIKMQCNWTIEYSPESVTIDPERGAEPGARCRVTSDWNDDFTVLTSLLDGKGYSQVSEWARALDGGAVPFYFWDCLPELTAAAVSTQHGGTSTYDVDLATRTGNQTARELWVLENG